MLSSDHGRHQGRLRRGHPSRALQGQGRAKAELRNQLICAPAAFVVAFVVVRSCVYVCISLLCEKETSCDLSLSLLFVFVDARTRSFARCRHHHVLRTKLRVLFTRSPLEALVYWFRVGGLTLGTNP